MRIAMMLCVLLAGFPLFAGHAAADSASFTWRQMNSDGFGDTSNRASYCMCEYNGNLYVGTYNTSKGTEIWLLHDDDSTWSQVNADGFGTVNNQYADCMAVFNGKLYVGTCNFADGAQVWAYDGTNWSQSNLSGFDNASNLVAFSLAVYSGKLYASTYNAAEGCEVWSYDGVSWSPCATGGFGDTANGYCYCLTTCNGYLYAGTMNYSTGAEVWEYDGTDWRQANSDGFGDTNNLAHSMTEYNGKLYVGTYNGANGAEIWCYDGANWNQANENGFGNAANLTSRSMTVYDNRLYLGTQNDASGGGVWCYDGSAWVMMNTAGFGDINNRRCYGLAQHNGRLWVGTYNTVTGIEVWRNQMVVPSLAVSSLPAGTVGSGDEITYTLRAGNGGDMPATGCKLTDLVPDHTTYVPGSTTLNGLPVLDILGASPLAIGFQVNSPGMLPGIIDGGAEAAVTFKVRVGTDVPAGLPVHDVGLLQAADVPDVQASVDNPTRSGATPVELPRTWHFAEGTTQPGFDEYILLSNMGADPMTATITYLTGAGAEKKFVHDLPAHSRRTVYANAEMPGENGLAAIVEGTAPFICERALYFNSAGIEGCHQVIGSDATSQDLFFAEGFTGREGEPFQEWILVLNPNAEAARVHVTYLFEGGATQRKDYWVAARSRYSIDVNREVGQGREVSAHLESDRGIVAERSMYFIYRGAWSGGHVGKAATAALHDWYLAEGFTGYNWSPFDEYILVSNSGDSDNAVQVFFMYPDGKTKTLSFTAPAHGRLTIFADEWAGEGKMVSARIHAAQPVVVERAMYFDYLLKEPGGSNCLAAAAPKAILYFAEGYTGDANSSFETYLLVQNTADVAKTAVVDYILASGDVVTREVSLPANSRTTVFVNDVVNRAGVEFSMRVSCKDGSPSLLAERATYSDYSGPCGTARGGDSVVGY